MEDGYQERRRTAQRLLARREEIARMVTDQFLDRHPDWIERYGPMARIRGEEDAVFHVEFLAGAVLTDDPDAFAAYARWTGRMLASRGIAPAFLAENLEQVLRASGEGLDRVGREQVERLGAVAVDAIRDGGDGDPRENAREEEHEALPLEAERTLYLQAVRGGGRRAALHVALQAVEAGATVPDVYRNILQPVQYEIGRLWERNEITVAQEHMATAITQYVVARLYSSLEVPSPFRGRALVTGVRGELHQLGANMVADVLEADGWDVRFLGTQLPHGGVLQAMEEHEPDLVAVSAALLANLPAVADLIEDARRQFGSELAVLVGGGAFRTSRDAWRGMGADGFGRDLEEAVSVARGLASEGD